MPPEPLRLAGALIVNDEGRLFRQRRSPHRRLFPDIWDRAEDALTATHLIGR